MILQRYTFGSKSQHDIQLLWMVSSCLWYCKDIHLEANHNHPQNTHTPYYAAYDIAKIYIWKQITTVSSTGYLMGQLLMILQRYTFGSKSQLGRFPVFNNSCCLWYCKDIHLEANHNIVVVHLLCLRAAYDIAKIYIWKQITTQTRIIY